MEVLFKEIGILTLFGSIQPFMGTFVMFKETSSKWDCGEKFNLLGNCHNIRKCCCVERWQNLGLKMLISNAKVDV